MYEFARVYRYVGWRITDEIIQSAWYGKQVTNVKGDGNREVVGGMEYSIRGSRRKTSGKRDKSKAIRTENRNGNRVKHNGTTALPFLLLITTRSQHFEET